MQKRGRQRTIPCGLDAAPMRRYDSAMRDHDGEPM
jgi:hypothetical protein